MVSMSPLDHPNLTVVHFLPFAGGKFWINCLAHHPDVLPLMSEIHDRHWVMFNIEDSLKQRLKLELINKTLPPANKLNDWCKYELGDIKMWGSGITNLIEVDSQNKISQNALSLLNNNRCFIVNHEFNQFKHIKHAIPSAKHIVLENSYNFQMLAGKLKGCEFNIPTKNQLVDVDAFRVNVDNTWFDTNITMYHVKECLTWMGLDPKKVPDPDLHLYIDKYFSLHR